MERTSSLSGSSSWLSGVSIYHRELLAKRVTTVAQLQREILSRWSQNAPVTKSSREIPVPLLPGETVQQYTHKFEQWVAGREQNLAELRQDPSRERNFWFSFAHIRAGLTGGTLASGFKRREGEEGPSSHYGPALPTSKRQRREESGSFPTKVNDDDGSWRHNEEDRYISGRTSALTQSKSRGELLAQYVIRPDEYLLQELGERRQARSPRASQESLAKIPVPLQPGETMHEYEHEFGRWMLELNESLESLYYKPIKERGFRFLFAQKKASKCVGSRLSSLSSLETKGPRDASRLRENKNDSCTVVEIDSLSTVCPPVLTHSALKHTTAREIIDDDLDFSIESGNAKKQSKGGSEHIFKQSDGDMSFAEAVTDSPAVAFPPSVVHVSPEEPGISCEKTLNGVNTDSASTIDHQHTASTITCSSSRPGKLAQQLSSLPTLTQRVLDLEAKVAQLQQELSMYRANDGSCKNAAKTLDGYLGNVDNNASTKLDGPQQVVRITSADMHRDKRVSCACFRLKDGQPLAKAYNHSNDLVIMNETAITDALTHIEVIEDAEEDRTEEFKSQLLELNMAVSQEKGKRAAALAALIVYYWKGAQQDLMSLLKEELSEDKKIVENHEKWLAIDSQLKGKTDQLTALEIQLHAQLQLVNALPLSVTGAGKAPRYKKLRDLSEKWTQEQAAKAVLENHRQELLMGFLRGDNEVRKLVKKLLAETWLLRG